MKSKTGFTRKDVFVVLGCVVFLLMALGAIGSGGRRRAKEAVCLSNLRRMGSAFSMFAAENDGRFMAGWYGYGTENTDMWMEALRPYYRNPDLRCCPEAVLPMSEIGGDVWNFTFIGWGVFEGECGQPSSWWPVVTGCDYGSYGMNAWACNPPPSDDMQFLFRYNWRSANVAGGDEIPLFGGAQWIEARPFQTDVPPHYEGMYWSGFDAMQCVCMNRHSGYVNWGFLDASARKVGLKQLWRLKWHRAFKTNLPPPDWSTEAPWMQDFQDY